MASALVSAPKYLAQVLTRLPWWHQAHKMNLKRKEIGGPLIQGVAKDKRLIEKRSIGTSVGRKKTEENRSVLIIVISITYPQYDHAMD